MNRKKQKARKSTAGTVEAPWFWQRELNRLASIAGEVRQTLPVIGVYTLLALATRFFQLGNAGLWMDEVVMLEETAVGRYAIISYRAHAGHLVPVSWFVAAFGETAMALRFWSAFLGSLAIPVLFLWGFLTASVRAAHVVAQLATVNVFLVMYAQDAAYYGGLTFYTAALMLTFALFFRGCHLIAATIAAFVSYIAYRTHPIAVLPATGILGGMTAGAVLHPATRKELFAVAPGAWREKPVLPLVLAAMAVVIMFFRERVTGIGSYVAGTIRPGVTTLINVEPGWKLFHDHLTWFLVNFHRPGDWERVAVVLPALGIFAGFSIAAIDAIRSRRAEAVSFLALAVLLPVMSYAVLFSMQWDRYFYPRYFIYLIPFLLGTVAVGIDAACQMLPRRERLLQLSALALVAGPGLICLLVYYGRDLSNQRGGAADLAASETERTSVLAINRNDPVEAVYHFRQAGLPHTPPAFSWIDRLYDMDLFAGALKYHLNGIEEQYVLSGWRYMPAPALYTWLEASLPVFHRGTSKWEDAHDLILYEWRYRDHVLYPNLAWHVGEGGLGDAGEVLIAGAGEWTNVPADTGTRTGPETIVSHQSAVHDASEWRAGAYIPDLPDSLVLTWKDWSTAPSHGRLYPTEDQMWVRNERDDDYSFLVYQPGDEDRYLVVHVRRRDEEDPLLNQNTVAIPPGMLVSIAVDGWHRGHYEVAAGPPEDVMLEIPLDLAPGNHRITIGGLQPRSVYTPYFPWYFYGIEWRKGRAAVPLDSLEELGRTISGGWTTLQSPAMEDNAPADGWIFRGTPALSIEDAITAPAGDHPFRLDISTNHEDAFLLMAPAMPVEPGTLATWWFHFRMEALLNHEFTPVYAFVDAQGRSITDMLFANGPNHRGSTVGPGWERRQVTVPVPAGAVFLVPGIQAFPLERRHDVESSTLWVGSFCSPGLAPMSLRDIQLPESYFHWEEERP